MEFITVRLAGSIDLYNKVSSGPCKTILLQVFQHLTDPKGITLIYRGDIFKVDDFHFFT